VDAKRILLRYGAPINVLDAVADTERIELARLIAKTLLPEREKHLRRVLADRGYMEHAPIKPRRSRKLAPLTPEAAAGGAAQQSDVGAEAEAKPTPPRTPTKTFGAKAPAKSSKKAPAAKAPMAKPVAVKPVVVKPVVVKPVVAKPSSRNPPPRSRSPSPLPSRSEAGSKPAAAKSAGAKPKPSARAKPAAKKKPAKASPARKAAKKAKPAAKPKAGARRK